VPAGPRPNWIGSIGRKSYRLLPFDRPARYGLPSPFGACESVTRSSSAPPAEPPTRGFVAPSPREPAGSGPAAWNGRSFEIADTADHSAIDAAYHAKYDRYGPGIVGAVTGPAAPPTTLRLTPQT